MDTSLEKIVDGEVSLVWVDTVCKILQCISVYFLQKKKLSHRCADIDKEVCFFSPPSFLSSSPPSLLFCTSLSCV